MVLFKKISFDKFLESDFHKNELDFFMFSKDQTQDDCFIIQEDEPSNFEENSDFFYLQIADINDVLYNLKEEIDDLSQEKKELIKYDKAFKKKAIYYYAMHDAFIGNGEENE